MRITGLFLYVNYLFAGLYEYQPHEQERTLTEIIWEETETEPFDELIFFWNALREPTRNYSFFISLHQEGGWSPWNFYADWGKNGQTLFVESPPDSFAETRRGVARPKNGVCDGFRVQIIAPGNLGGLQTCGAFLSHLATWKIASCEENLPSVFLSQVPKQSLITLRLERQWDLSMVASMLSALRYLSSHDISSADFAEYTMDGDFESFDFWPLHAAEAFHRLEGKYSVRIERLSHFSQLHHYLTQGTPVLVDILGSPLGALPWPPYRSHILCITGYDAATHKVHCLDPAFPNDKATAVSYSLQDFLHVWGKRKNIACVFESLTYKDLKLMNKSI